MTAPAAFSLRAATSADRPAIAAVLARAFADEPEVVALDAALDDRPDSVALVAAVDDVVAGVVRVTRGWIDAPEALVAVDVLGPLGVDPAWHRRGMGRALVAAAVSEAGLRGAPVVLLEGDPGYYSRLGWRPAAELGITAPSERIPAAACQAMVLASHEPWMRGRLVYADTFWAHDCVGLRGERLAEVQARLAGVTPASG